MYPEHQTPFPQSINQAVEKFYDLNDDMHLVRSLGRKVFFEYLRACPALTLEEIDTARSIVDLVADLCRLKETGNN